MAGVGPGPAALAVVVPRVVTEGAIAGSPGLPHCLQIHSRGKSF